MEKEINARKLIDRLAKEQGVKYDTRYKWRLRGSVPHHWRLPLMKEAAKAGLTIPLEAFDNYGFTN